MIAEPRNIMRAPSELSAVLNSDLADLEAIGLELFERFDEIHERVWHWDSDGTGDVGIVYLVHDRLYEVRYAIGHEATSVTEIRERVR